VPPRHVRRQVEIHDEPRDAEGAVVVGLESALPERPLLLVAAVARPREVLREAVQRRSAPCLAFPDRLAAPAVEPHVDPRGDGLSAHDPVELPPVLVGVRPVARGNRDPGLPETDRNRDQIVAHRPLRGRVGRPRVYAPTVPRSAPARRWRGRG
jgi:hypothetical protein